MAWFFSRAGKFTQAVKKGQIEKVNEMLQSPAGFDLDQALQDAVYINYQAGIVRSLIQAGADAASRGLMRIAARLGTAGTSAPSSDDLEPRLELATEVVTLYVLRHTADTGTTPSRDQVQQWVAKVASQERLEFLRLGGQPQELRTFLSGG